MKKEKDLYRNFGTTLIFGLCLLASSPVFGIRPTEERRPIQQATSDSSGEESKKPVEVVQVILRPYGFEPAVLTVDRKEFLLVIRNRTADPEMDLRVEKDSDAGWKTANLTAKAGKAWRNKMNLDVGRYTITDSRRSAFQCKLIITEEKPTK